MTVNTVTTNGQLSEKASLLFFSLLYISRSDVWAYGILMFEILTIGENPYRYSNVKNREYKEKLKAEFE